MDQIPRNFNLILDKQIKVNYAGTGYKRHVDYDRTLYAIFAENKLK